jgi:4-diphosphocytidyl-2-C-methyl-D-erythritol kinase
LPKIFAVLVNPQVPAPTPKVFAALGLAPGLKLGSHRGSLLAEGGDTAQLFDFTSLGRNDLKAAAIRIAPAIAAVLERLSQVPEAKLTGMSGSGATCFALFANRRGAAAARRILAAEHPEWWVEATDLH